MTTLAPEAHVRTALVAGGVALSMVGLAFASVPLYRIFCQVTGFGGTTQVADALPSAEAVRQAAGKTVRVRLDGNVNGVPWRFAPVDRPGAVPIGEQRLVFFRATNHAAQPVTGTATFNVSPAAAGRYFVKMQCFCFNEQTLAAGQSVDMPVVFYVDPAILDDPDAGRIDEITLSYTFFPVAAPQQAPAIRATGQTIVPHRAG